MSFFVLTLKGEIGMNKPRIGLIPLVDNEKDSYWMLPGYMNGILNAGGIPVVLPLTDDMDILKQIVDTYDGFLFTGGHDVSPKLYGEDKLDVCGECCELRDNMEKALFTMLYEKDKAILGICRGIQFINSMLGGTLYQDLPTQKPSDIEHHQLPPYDEPIHKVNITPNTPLYELLGREELSVNSYHHQAVKELSSELCAMAYSTDGLVEAIYSPYKNYIWAVQWHPEFSYLKDENSRKIFKSFVDAASI